ncbi:SH2 domain-containing protein [Balamuthia mandrillaris]
MEGESGVGSRGNLPRGMLQEIDFINNVLDSNTFSGGEDPHYPFSMQEESEMARADVAHHQQHYTHHYSDHSLHHHERQHHHYHHQHQQTAPLLAKDSTDKPHDGRAAARLPPQWIATAGDGTSNGTAAGMSSCGDSGCFCYGASQAQQCSTVDISKTRSRGTSSESGDAESIVSTTPYESLYGTPPVISTILSSPASSFTNNSTNEGGGATNYPFAYLSEPKSEASTSSNPPSSPGPSTSPTNPTMTSRDGGGSSCSSIWQPSPASRLLDQMWDSQRNQQQQLDLLRSKQKQVMQRPQKEPFEEVCRLQAELRQAINFERNTLHHLYRSTVLALHDLNRWHSLIHQLDLQHTQLAIFEREILQLTEQKPDTPQCYVELAITDRPPSDVIFKAKPFSQAYVVHVLTGAYAEVSFLSKMNAAIVCESHLWKSKFNKRTMHEDSKVLEPQQHTVLFQPKFLVGTRKSAVNLRFSISVKCGAALSTIESPLSDPFVVITNECQWAEAEGTLIKKQVFGGHGEASWPQFANVFHDHFVRATKQDPTRPTRTLFPCDFDYIHEQFFGRKPMVTLKDFDNFWNWCGKGVHLLRYQRHVGHLWKDGLIFGFISKEDVERRLIMEQDGAFLVRFSQTQSGSFAVGYKHEGVVKHYLVKPEDTAGPKKNLTDFLHSTNYFVFLLKVTADPDGNPILTSCNKKTVLEKYLSQRPLVETAGYDDLPK